jgi:hypothetical protein
LWERVARTRDAFVTGEGFLSVETTPHPALRATFSRKGRREVYRGGSYADRASAPSIIATAFARP